MVVPSDEDSQTFQVNFASGESYKLRAANVKDRQVWVDRIRAVAHRHESAMARDHAPPTGKYVLRFFSRWFVRNGFSCVKLISSDDFFLSLY